MTKSVKNNNIAQINTEKDVQEKHAGGRPAKYKAKYCKEIISFFDIEPIKEIDVKLIQKNGSVIETTKEVAENLRFFSSFARKIGVCHDTLLEWCKRHKEFSESYKICKELQKEHLIICGLKGFYNPAAFCFTAKNITDMRDKQEFEHSADAALTQILSSIAEKGRSF
jgi:hypothetical protein